ncbi:MAG: nitrilase family protein [Bacteroidales bacterium]|nr:nitrilase family protein [Bacteroidales bacterium]
MQSDIIARNPEENFKHLDELFEKIQDDRDIIILPETFNTGFPAEAEIFAEEENGPTMTWLKQKAKEKNCIVCGSFLTSFRQQSVSEPVEDTTRHFDKLSDRETRFLNTMVFMYPDGSYQAYDKRHTFSMGGEKDLGNGQYLITLNIKDWKIRPFVCYDLRFPVWLRNNYENGEFEYDLAILIANWPMQKSFVWNTLLSARAIENQAYYIGVNRVGIDHNEIPYIGETKVVDGKGRTLAEIEGDKEGILEFELDKEALNKFRGYFTVYKDWDKFDIKK